METQLAYIKARAQGKSYSTIAKELGISKATCTSWEKTLKAEIEDMRTAQLEELYTAYNMKREARIKTLGDILKNIDQAIAEKPLTELPADKLLEIRLKYGRELKEEYTAPVEVDTDNTLDGLLEQYNQLYIDSKTGKYNPADITARLKILDAKKATLYCLSAELQREESDPLSLDFAKQYRSTLLRHEDA